MSEKFEDPFEAGGPFALEGTTLPLLEVPLLEVLLSKS
jgi:hypothetical protein